MDAGEKQVVEQILHSMTQLLRGKQTDPICCEDDSKLLGMLTQQINEVVNSFSEIWNFILPLSQGILNIESPKASNVLASPFKELHSQLRTLVWQVQQIEQGDYKQRVVFMGEFSQAFNSMVEALEEKNHLINDNISSMKKIQSDLKMANNHLEIRVQERTQELNTINNMLEDEIEERIAKEEEIYQLVISDQLTGLPNRRLFNDRIEQAIVHAVRNEKSFEVLFLDLDGFKMINDTMGHAQGDELLKKVAERLTKVLRKNDVIARVGGDEFLILIHNAPDKESIEKVCQNIINAIKEPFNFPTSEIYITTSIGVSIYPQDGEDGETLVKNADIAMYVAKENGKGNYAFCNEQMKNNLDEVMMLTNDLYHALAANELELYYQPQVSTNSGGIVGLEALLRWNHPKLGLIGPADFIPIAEKTGLIVVIGEWVLRTACIQAKAWQDSGFPDLIIAINLSVNQISSHKLVQQVSNILLETGLNPKKLELEITESIFMKDINEIVNTLNKLKRLDIRIAIDDFGTDYSSLSYLKQLPLDRIKIAKTFIDGIDNNLSDESIISAIIVLGKKLGLDLIAEGVETDQQLQFLKNQLREEIQGFYFYKPMPAKEIERLLRSTKDSLNN